MIIEQGVLGVGSNRKQFSIVPTAGPVATTNHLANKTFPSSLFTHGLFPEATASSRGIHGFSDEYEQLARDWTGQSLKLCMLILFHNQ